MKKKIGAAIGAMALAGVIGFAFSQSGVVNADPTLSKEDIRSQVKEQYPGTITELEFEKDGKHVVYEVEVELEGKEYELKIDGDSGEVLKLEEKEISSTQHNNKKQQPEEVKITEKDKKSVEEEQGSSKTVDKEKDQNENGNKSINTDDQDDQDDNSKTQHQSTDKKAVIGIAQAEKIALQNFSGTIEELELDEDDGRLVYEVKVEKGNREAEIEIDAYTGEVLVLEIETDDDDDDDDDHDD